MFFKVVKDKTVIWHVYIYDLYKINNVTAWEMWLVNKNQTIYFASVSLVFK